jgi:hypothetical protein
MNVATAPHSTVVTDAAIAVGSRDSADTKNLLGVTV